MLCCRKLHVNTLYLQQSLLELNVIQKRAIKIGTYEIGLSYFICCHWYAIAFCNIAMELVHEVLLLKYSLASSITYELTMNDSTVHMI